MKTFKKLMNLTLCGIIGTTSMASACSYISYQGKDDMVMTGRSMDWTDPMQTNLWALPAGLKHNGQAGPNSLEWTSKYGSVVSVAFNKATVDGINTAGLNVSILYLSQAKYPTIKKGQPSISTFMWGQYLLDNFASVDEIIQALNNQKTNIVAPPLPGGYQSSIHVVATDKTGNNIIVEFVDGKMKIHHGSQYDVATNDPTYDEQLAQNQYWQNLDGDFLPGTSKSEDRFARGWYYLHQAPKVSDQDQAAAIVFSIIRNISVPIGTSDKDHPNLAPTLWRSVADLKHKTYYFEPTNRPNVFWVDLNDLNLSRGGPVEKLALQDGQVYAGNVADQFKPTKQFETPDAYEIIKASQKTQ